MTDEYNIRFNKFVKELKKSYPDLRYTNKQVLSLNNIDRIFANEIKDYLFVIALKKVYGDKVTINDSILNDVSKKSVYRFPITKDKYDKKELISNLGISIDGRCLTLFSEFTEKDLHHNKEKNFTITTPCYDFNKLITYLNVIREKFKSNALFINIDINSFTLYPEYGRTYSNISRNYFEYNKSMMEHNIGFLSAQRNKMSNNLTYLISLCVELCMDYNLLIKLDTITVEEATCKYYDNLQPILNTKDIDVYDIIKIYALFSNYVLIKDKYVL